MADVFEARSKLSQTLTQLWAEDPALKEIRQKLAEYGVQLHDLYKKCLRGEPVNVGGKTISGYRSAKECLEKVAEALGLDKKFFEIWHKGGA